MFSFKLVEAPGECEGGCGTVISDRVAGHYYQRPMCATCFAAAAPELARILRAIQPDACIQFVPKIELIDDPDTGARTQVRPEITCANCGDRLSQSFVGFHKGDPLCRACFSEHAPDLAELLLLWEAASEAAKGSFAQSLHRLVVDFFKTVNRRVAESSEAPRSPDRTPGKERK